MTVSDDNFLEDSISLRRQAVASALDELLRACETELSEIQKPNESHRKSDCFGLGAASHRASSLLAEVGLKGDSVLLRTQTEEMETLFCHAGLYLEFASLPEQKRLDEIDKLVAHISCCDLEDPEEIKFFENLQSLKDDQRARTLPLAYKLSCRSHVRSLRLHVEQLKSLLFQNTSTSQVAGEVTRSGKDEKSLQLDHSGIPIVGVLDGGQSSGGENSDTQDEHGEDIIPSWDGTVLRVDGAEVLRLSGRAKNQNAVLKAFEEGGWPSRIEDPFDDAYGQKRRDAIHELNDRLRSSSHVCIEFESDGAGTGICWKRL